MRTILHVDMNSYFATAEQQANPFLRGKPIGVIKALNRGCIIAASVEAKKFGVKTGMNVWDAKKKCPHIILVPSDMDKYFSITCGMVEILKSYSPVLEIFSIDECFLDVTQTKGLYCGGAWEMALEIKKRIREELGEWMKCSVGIGFSKIVAKLASEMHKPDGLTWLTVDNYLEKTESVEVSEVCGIGFSRTAYLRTRGAFTLGQARRLELPEEIKDLVFLRNDDDLVTVSELEAAKSVSRTYTTYKTLNSKFEILKLVRNLVEEVCAKLREMEMVGRTFILSLSGNSCQSCLPAGRFSVRKTINTPTDDPLLIYDLFVREYERNTVTEVRQAGVWVTNLMDNGQLTIDRSRTSLLGSVDKVNQKFGLFTLYPASLLGNVLIRPEVTGFLGDKWYRLGGPKRT